VAKGARTGSTGSAGMGPHEAATEFSLEGVAERSEIDFGTSMNARRTHELAILNDVARALNASVDLPALLTRALEKVAELLGLRTGWVLLFDEGSGEPYLAAAQELPPGPQAGPGRVGGAADRLAPRTGWVLLCDEGSGEPYLAAAQELPPGLQEEPELMTGSCYCLDSLRDDELDGPANVGVVSCSRLRKLGLAEGRTAGPRYHPSAPPAAPAGRRGP